MATYPIKMLKDEQGQLFIPLTNSDSVVTTTGDTLEELIDAKVDKVTGKGLSTNDYTTAEKQKLAGLDNYELPKASSSTLGGIKVGTNLSIDSNGVLSADAQHIDVDSALSTTSENPVQNKIIKNALDDKVDKVSGKGLSTNDYTTDEKDKLAGIAASAEVNQNAFSNVKVDTIMITADSKTDTLTLAAGDNITLTPNKTSDTITIAATDTTYTAATAAPGDVASSSSTGTSINYARQDHTHGISLATGDNKGQVKIAGTNVSVKGLGSAAYTASTAYATAAQGTLAANAIPSSQKGAPSGVAELDENGKVPTFQLPSFVDDVIEGYLYDSKFYKESSYTTEIDGEAGKIYVDLPTNKTYRWSGSAFTEISSSLALGTTSSTAFRGDYGHAAYAHAVTNKGSAFTSGLYKITTNAEGHVTGAVAVEKADITALGIPSTNTTYESKTAASGGTDVSLVTTGEKYTWNNKQNALSTQTAYSAKGTATKVPQITTNTLGQVTKIEEVTITQPTVNNGQLTIQKNGTNVATFTANQSGNSTANITVPTKVSELTNDSNYITNTGSTSGNAGTATTLQTYAYNRNNNTNTWFKVATTTITKQASQWPERHAFLFIKGSHNSNYNQNGIIAIDAVGNGQSGKIGSYNAQFMSATKDLNLENFYIEFLHGDSETDGIVNFWIRANTNAYASWQVKILQNTGWTIASSGATATEMPSTGYTGKNAILAGSVARSVGDKNGNDITTTYYLASNPNGYTSNTGTITKVQANGTDVASSGTANIPAASTSAYGVTKLSDATNSTSTALAATANAVKKAYDLAASKTSNTGTVTSVGLTAGAGISISGGPITTSGSITVKHSNSITAQTTSGLYPIKIDAQGHITQYGEAYEVATIEEIKTMLQEMGLNVYVAEPTNPTDYTYYDDQTE